MGLPQAVGFAPRHRDCPVLDGFAPGYANIGFAPGCRVCPAQRATHSVQRTACSAQRAAHSVQLTAYSLQRIYQIYIYISRMNISKAFASSVTRDINQTPRNAFSPDCRTIHERDTSAARQIRRSYIAPYGHGDVPFPHCGSGKSLAPSFRRRPFMCPPRLRRNAYRLTSAL